ncbi:TPA: type-F conjugative transfer system protein TrbI [Legionella pneumophila]|nr:type-F conjugative transfer system protein TrbI [Legionella pneumophila]HAU9905853.1 type-F conjugative transfer system protein TrbI [Legionella pneumophila]HAU9927299.1 type-F conjugative transfer system protein TrbI [Legionella pneumophila]HAU9930232.1 type-F conjugative transfer system protein TrbI [Legionella pneumophila]HAU9933902.1 type-F conjugative transfer system protein TrbI [Legionella pneumophila]
MRLIHLVVAIVATFLILGVAVYCLKPKACVVLFDAETIKGRLIRQLAERKATDAQVISATKKFNDSLSAVLTHYAKRYGVVVINRNMVLAGGEDVTEQIASELSRAMSARS